MVWSGCQQRVARDLRDHGGFSTYAPFGSRFANRTVGRSSGLERRVRCVLRYPVLGSYMFVGHATKLVGRSTHMRIAAVLGDSEGPTLISPDVIRIIAQAELDGEWDKAGPRARITPAYYEGQEIKIKEGPFAGFFGIVRGLRADLRLKIESSIFGRPTMMTIEADQVEPV
jgi:transcription antitermination factor NusG